MQKEIRNDEDTEVAPLIENFLGNGDTFKKIREH